jgi:hypothetical protein
MKFMVHPFSETPTYHPGLVLLGKSTPETHGFFTIKLFGLYGENFPIIQFYESMNILEQCGLEKHNF